VRRRPREHPPRDELPNRPARPRRADGEFGRDLANRRAYRVIARPSDDEGVGFRGEVSFGRRHHRTGSIAPAVDLSLGPGAGASSLRPSATAARWDAPRIQRRSPRRTSATSLGDKPRSRAHSLMLVPEASNCSRTEMARERIAA
jgi:hypothetical protein